FAVLVERPAEHPVQNGPLPDAARARTVLPLGMAVDDDRCFAVVRDVSALLAREPPVALGRTGLLRVGKLGEPLGAVVKKGEHASSLGRSMKTQSNMGFFFSRDSFRPSSRQLFQAISRQATIAALRDSISTFKT